MKLKNNVPKVIVPDNLKSAIISNKGTNLQMGFFPYAI